MTILSHTTYGKDTNKIIREQSDVVVVHIHNYRTKSHLLTYVEYITKPVPSNEILHPVIGIINHNAKSIRSEVSRTTELDRTKIAYAYSLLNEIPTESIAPLSLSEFKIAHVSEVIRSEGMYRNKKATALKVNIYLESI